jgi:hypothetical protein
MAVVNLPALDVEASATGGLKLGYSAYRNAAGAIVKGLKRGFGGPTGTTNGGNTSDVLIHDAVTETYDDAWTVQNIAVDDSPAVDLTATVVSNMKKIEISVLDAPHGSTGGIYVGPADTVTSTGATRGRYLAPGSAYLMPLGPNQKVWAICAAGLVANVQVVQFA